MSFIGPRNIKMNGGLGRREPSDRNVMGLLFTGGYAAAGIALGDVVKLTSIEEAEAKGLNYAADVASGHQVHYHIREFFLVNPSGELWIQMLGIAHTALALSASPGGHGGMLLSKSGYRVRSLGVVFNHPEGADGLVYHPTVTVLPTFVVAAMNAAQVMVNALFAEFRYLDMVVIDGAYLLQGDYTGDLRPLEVPNVALTIGVDAQLVEQGQPHWRYASAVGTVMGSIGVRKLSECIGSVNIERKPVSKRGQADYPLTDLLNERWLSAHLTSGVALDQVSQANQVDLTDGAFIYMGRYEGYPGIFINDSHTAAPVSNDFSVIENNRVWNEAARKVRRALIPVMNSTVDIDQATGFIRPTTITDWTARAKRELEQLVAEGEISAFTFSIDPAQNVLGGDPIITKLSVTPRGIARAIENELGFTNPFNA